MTALPDYRKGQQSTCWAPEPAVTTQEFLLATFGTGAVTLRKRDSLDTVWGAEGGYYMKSDGLYYCQKCPPGTYLAAECKEQNGSSECKPCGYGEYMEYPSAFQTCRECSKCREDQVEQSPCQPVRNTVCACRNGTFCPPEHPCEMCQKCQPRCPEGQMVQKPCRPDSDLQCAPATDSTVPLYISVIIGTAACVGVFGVVFLLWKYRCSSPGDGRPSNRRRYEMTSMFRKLWYRSVSTGAEDNATNNNLQNQQRELEPPLVVPSSGSRSRRKRLVPVPGKDPTQVLQDTFYPLAEKIPRDDWKKFGRKLYLEENDIVMVNSSDAFYDMLYKWLIREGSKASLNTLLDALDELHLCGVAEKISSMVLQNGTFQNETS
ncbi:tumor necrosis factor receptor superfamily member 10B-like isoform X2 [Sylvia atricapilla]|uniref:tumor necrosis factor receptor superfamily member 10B-like isoform X2 n=1 Tax=Sylvia atricapilla TaxID=48155 RepID=UPI003391A508